MPIRPENKARYPADWPEISRRIRERDGNRCKRCKAQNGAFVARSRDGESYMLLDGAVFDASTGAPLGYAKGSEYPTARIIRIVLTVAHLDHRPENCADENLEALCQRCHLAYDAAEHAASRAATLRGRKASGDLFALPSPLNAAPGAPPGPPPERLGLQSTPEAAGGQAAPAGGKPAPA